MLAKQGWRILTEPYSLATKLLKARYFPHTDFLNVELGVSPSYLWRSILSAKEAVNSGCRRRIGDGLSTKVWKVPWLPCEDNGYLSTVIIPELHDIHVQNLMHPNSNTWDSDLLADLFDERDYQSIQRIPIPLNQKNDSWFWLRDPKGKFTVRSAYKQLQGPSDSTMYSFWHRLWTLKIPSKVSCFLWRVCKGFLPTMLALASKQVQVNVRCPWSFMHNESDVHILFECDFAKSVWSMTTFHAHIGTNYNESCSAMLNRLFNTLNLEQCAMIGMLCWSLWNRRNNWVWNRVNGSAFGVKSAALSLLSEWKRARDLAHIEKHSTSVDSFRWSKPPIGWFSVNVDASLCWDNCVGVGAVIRDSEGKFVCATCIHIAGKWQPREAEALSLKSALSWTKNLGYDHCIFQTDSKILAEACKGIDGISYFHTIALDCVDLCKHFNHILVQYVRRSANGVAHLLATHSTSDLREWIVDPPDFIRDVLYSDSL